MNIKAERLPGVYQITNTVNGHRYIGSSVNVYKRLSYHKTMLCHGNHYNKHLQSAWNKYGEENFKSSALLYCDRSETIKHEQIFLDNLKPEYNIATCAMASGLGLHPSDETRAKIGAASSKAMTNGRKAYLSAIMKGNKYNLGRIPSDETKAKMGEAHKGRAISEETKAKISEAHKGRKASDETRAKIGAASKEMWHSQGHKAKMSAAFKGRAISEEHKAKLSAAFKGRAISEETRAKIGAANKANWQKRKEREAFWQELEAYFRNKKEQVTQ